MKLLDHIKSIDIELLFLINNKLSNKLFDIIMPIITNENYWIMPIIFLISYLGINLILLVMGYSFEWYNNVPGFLSIPLIQEWIMAVPATAGARAIMIGIALGIIAQSFRIITGRERSILGD